MKQQEANQFLKGLNLDTNPIAMSNQQLSYALNATLITKNGNEMVLQNDMGNGRVESANLPAGYVPVGIKEHGGIVYVASYNPLTNQSQIGSFPSPERNISKKEESDADIIFGYFSINDVIPQLTMKVQLTPNVMRPGDKFSVDMANYSQLESLLKHIDNGSMTLNVAVLNSSGGLVKLEYMNDLDASGVVKYEYVFDKPYYSYIRYYQNRYNEEEIKFNVYKSKIIGELYLTLELNVPSVIPYEVTAFSYIVENVPINKRKPGKSGYFDVYLPRPYELNGESVNQDLKFISKYKIKSNLEIYECTTNEATGDVNELIAWNDEEVEFAAGTTVRVYFTQEDIDTENIKTLEITPYFDDPLDIEGAELSNSGWLPMLTKKISVNPAKVGTGEVYLSEFRYYINILDEYMSLDYAFESYLRKNEYVTDIKLKLLPYEDILSKDYKALDNVAFQLRPSDKSAYIGKPYYIQLQLQTNRRNYFGNFQEQLSFENIDDIKNLYVDDTVAHNDNMWKLSEGYAAFVPGQSYIGYIEITTERHTAYTEIETPEIRVQRSKPLAIFTCGDVNELYFNTNLSTYIRGDASNTTYDDQIVVPSSMYIGYKSMNSNSIYSKEISNITYEDKGIVKSLYAYGDMDQTDLDPAALIKVKSVRKYNADYSLSVNPKYNVTDYFPIGIDAIVKFKQADLSGSMKREKATVNGNPLYYEFTNSQGEQVLINTADKKYEQPEVSEQACILDDQHKFAYFKETPEGAMLLHIETYDLPSVYYGIALRQDDYYVNDVDMLLPFNYNIEESPLFGQILSKEMRVDLKTLPPDHGSIKEGVHYQAATWFVQEAWRQGGDGASQKEYGISTANESDHTYWDSRPSVEQDHPYYPDFDDFKAFNKKDGSHDGDFECIGYIDNARYKRDRENHWHFEIDSYGKSYVAKFLEINPIIRFLQCTPDRDTGYISSTYNNHPVIKAIQEYDDNKKADNRYLTNFCSPVLEDLNGRSHSLNEWGFASLALYCSKGSNNIRTFTGGTAIRKWNETYVDQLNRTFDHIFGKQEHITEDVLFKKVESDEFDTYTNPYKCVISLQVGADVEIYTTHYDNINRTFQLEFNNSGLVIVNKITEGQFQNAEHAIQMPEIAVQDNETNKVYTKESKIFKLQPLAYGSDNYTNMAQKFYDFEPGNYTLLKDHNQFYIFGILNGQDVLFNANTQYFRGKDGIYYHVNCQDTSKVIYGRTIMQELKDHVLTYKRNPKTNWYGLYLGSKADIIVGSRSKKNVDMGTHCNYGVLKSTSSYNPEDGRDCIGDKDTHYEASWPGMGSIANARLLDDFNPDTPGTPDLHYIYDYNIKGTIPSIAYFVDEAVGDNKIIAMDVEKSATQRANSSMRSDTYDQDNSGHIINGGHTSTHNGTVTNESNVGSPSNTSHQYDTPAARR